ncbi:hypothetical protein ALP91_02172 [Pseudomonas savastanoi pv. glycinea]|uniref:Uncharacterized protein n=1 Tax=Pseudomonas savastanoi pv. glycinea TaxID=318 RepID=A0AB74B1W4_PSESG|nr:hypothetical protein ALO37_200021 [Pseudomonas savastanoi pv. glycinea]RMM73627.1 hypothetical protein ALQ75_04010 [Pseudomonas savastanoi pv. glycinea]RMP52798.1 hypothetical protein ALQ21_200119 [Pseudomonas savastanoi pv. glycinea]RMQ02000.1 hypothetical protein ALQ12_02978 [Pseudomonas savastanoi pv. glycinea]RMQ02335.1 hypothetical protein ALQ13_01991 [Pseudomonas savastanoi pv. glycinea]
MSQIYVKRIDQRCSTKWTNADFHIPIWRLVSGSTGQKNGQLKHQSNLPMLSSF